MADPGRDENRVNGILRHLPGLSRGPGSPFRRAALVLAVDVGSGLSAQARVSLIKWKFQGHMDRELAEEGE